MLTSKGIHKETTVKRQEEGKGWVSGWVRGKTNQTERACLNMPQYRNDLLRVCGIQRLLGKVGSGIEMRGWK
jgi:hypothetical protein